MLAIVRIALSRPYTFVVMAMLIVIFGVDGLDSHAYRHLSRHRHPRRRRRVDLQRPAAGRYVRARHLLLRTLAEFARSTISSISNPSRCRATASSRSIFQPKVNINSALAQITAASQTVLKLLPPGITPPYVLSFNASSVPILQLALSSDALTPGADLRRRAEFHPPATRDRPRRGHSFALWRQSAAGSDRPRSAQSFRPMGSPLRTSSKRSRDRT